MILTPVERRAFILDAMANMAGGMLANEQTVDNARRAFGDGATDKLVDTIYITAVAMADKYDAENP